MQKLYLLWSTFLFSFRRVVCGVVCVFLVSSFNCFADQIVSVEVIDVRNHEPLEKICDQKVERILPSGLHRKMDQDDVSLLLGECVASLSKYCEEVFDEVNRNPDGSTEVKFLVIPCEAIPRVIFRRMNFWDRLFFSQRGIYSGAPFHERALQHAVSAFQRRLKGRGYCDAEVRYGKDQKGTIWIDLDKGPFFYWESVVIDAIDPALVKRVRASLVSRKYHALLHLLYGSGAEDISAVERDVLVLQQILKESGYQDARVSYELVDGKRSGGQILCFKVNQGPLYQVGKVSVSGVVFLPPGEVDCTYGLREGEACSPEIISRANKSLESLYKSYGYVDVDVKTKAHLRQGEDLYDLEVQVIEGKPFVMGDVVIEGDEITDPSLIIAKSHLIRGELLTGELMQRARDHLLGLKIFDEVSIIPFSCGEMVELNGKELQYRNVLVRVKELDRVFFAMVQGSWGGGGGSWWRNIIGTGKLSVCNASLFGWLTGGRHPFLGSGEEISLNVDAGFQDRSVNLGVMTPSLGGSADWYGAVDLYWKNRSFLQKSKQTENKFFFTQESKGIGFRCWKNIRTGPVFRHSLGGSFNLKFENTSFQESPQESPQETLQETLQDLSQDPPQGEPKGREQLLPIFSFFWDVSTRGLNCERGPVRFRLEPEFSIPLDGCRFVKAKAQLRLSEPLSDSCDIYLYGELNQALSLMKQGDKKYLIETLPYLERLRMGGQSSVRGFNCDMFLPKSVEEGHEVPVGGASLAKLSAEFQWKVSKGLVDGPFLFVDAGFISPEAWHLMPLKVSCGMGVRLNIPVLGKVTLGIGEALNPSDRKEKNPIFFSMGAPF